MPCYVVAKTNGIAHQSAVQNSESYQAKSSLKNEQSAIDAYKFWCLKTERERAIYIIAINIQHIDFIPAKVKHFGETNAI